MVGLPLHGGLEGDEALFSNDHIDEGSLDPRQVFDDTGGLFALLLVVDEDFSTRRVGGDDKASRARLEDHVDFLGLAWVDTDFIPCLKNNSN